MPPFKDGTCANTIDRAGLVQRYIRVSAGPQRGQYVHRMIAVARSKRASGPRSAAGRGV